MQKKIIAALSIFTLTLPAFSQACTLYGATGSTYVQGGGTLVSKNRDWSPMPQTIKYVAPSQGYRYLGLFAGQKYNLTPPVSTKKDSTWPCPPPVLFPKRNAAR
jgi:hypothetical protein